MIQAKTELNQTSAQEEFAKWAKLRRRVDKGMADIDKLSKCLPFYAYFKFSNAVADSRLAESKSSFASKFNWLLWAATTGAQFILVWWYRREPVFYLPPGWLGPLGYFLALPSAPKGTLQPSLRA